MAAVGLIGVLSVNQCIVLIETVKFKKNPLSHRFHRACVDLLPMHDDAMIGAVDIAAAEVEFHSAGGLGEAVQ